MDIDRDVYIKLFKTIQERIKYLEGSDPDNPVIDELKLLLSDNLSKEGKIHNRSSLMNKNFHLFFSNCKDYMHKYETGHLYN